MPARKAHTRAKSAVIVTRADAKSKTLNQVTEKPIKVDPSAVDPAIALIEDTNARDAMLGLHKRVKKVEQQVGTATPLPRQIGNSDHVKVTVYHHRGV